MKFYELRVTNYTYSSVSVIYISTLVALLAAALLSLLAILVVFAKQAVFG